MLRHDRAIAPQREKRRQEVTEEVPHVPVVAVPRRGLELEAGRALAFRSSLLFP